MTYGSVETEHFPPDKEALQSQVKQSDQDPIAFDAMDACAHMKSTTRRRSPPPPRTSTKVNASSSAQLPRQQTTTPSDWIDCCENHVSISSLDGANLQTWQDEEIPLSCVHDSFRNDPDYQEWCEGRKCSRLSIPPRMHQHKNDYVTDEDMTVSDSTYSTSHSSTQSNGSIRTFLQKVDSFRVAASNRMESKKTALEESLMKQLAHTQYRYKAEMNEMELKLHQREAAIKTLERALCLRNDAVDEVRNELDVTRQQLDEAKHSIKRLERKLLSKGTPTITDTEGARQRSRTPDAQQYAVEGLSIRRTAHRSRHTKSPTNLPSNGPNSDAHLSVNVALRALLDQDQRTSARRPRMGDRQSSQRSINTEAMSRTRRAPSRGRSCDSTSRISTSNTSKRSVP